MKRPSIKPTIVALLVAVGLVVTGFVIISPGHINPNPVLDVVAGRPGSVPLGARASWDIYDGVRWTKCVATPRGAVYAVWFKSEQIPREIAVDTGGDCNREGAGVGLWVTGLADHRPFVNLTRVAKETHFERIDKVAYCTPGVLDRSGPAAAILARIIRRSDFGEPARQAIEPIFENLARHRYRVAPNAGTLGYEVFCTLQLAD